MEVTLHDDQLQEQRLKNQMEEKELRFILGSAFLLTMFLFFIDEGYYDFRWMKSWGNWIVFFIYFIILTAGQFLIWKLASHIKFSFKKMSLVFLIGSSLALLLAFKFIFTGS